MRLIAFPQWDKLTSLLRGMARQSAADYAQRNIARIIPKNGVVYTNAYIKKDHLSSTHTFTDSGKYGMILSCDA